MNWYIGNEWKMERKGLRKVVLALHFTKLEKPTQIAKVKIKVKNIENLQNRKSNILIENQEFTIEMGTALTPIDCYIEILIQQMVLGEVAHCFIKCNNGEEISFIVTLESILESIQIHKLTIKEMYERAQRLKENGVIMFKEYPKFAHDYFARAAKCLISYKPFNDLTTDDDGVSCNDMEKLFINIQTNLAACLLNEKRYDDVLYHTEFVETETEPSEKGIYRRAMAYYCTQEFDKAQKTIEKFPNHHEKKEFIKLQQRIAQSWKSSNDQYKNVVQRMFS